MPCFQAAHMIFFIPEVITLLYCFYVLYMWGKSKQLHYTDFLPLLICSHWLMFSDPMTLHQSFTMAWDFTSAGFCPEFVCPRIGAAAALYTKLGPVICIGKFLCDGIDTRHSYSFRCRRVVQREPFRVALISPRSKDRVLYRKQDSGAQEKRRLSYGFGRMNDLWIWCPLQRKK